MTGIHRVNELHNAAMDEAEYAFIARRRGNEAEARVHFEKAYDLESEAAHLTTDTSLEPTRSVLHRSAASLAYNCGKMRDAEKLIAVALAGDPPEPIARELRELMRQVVDALLEPA